MRRAALSVVVLLTALGSYRCSTFTDDNGGASTDGGGGGGGDSSVGTPADAGTQPVGDASPDGSGPPPGSCWPWKSGCGAQKGCCLDFAGGGSCTEEVDCPFGHAFVQCRSVAECPMAPSVCCADVKNIDPDSGLLATFDQVIRTTCKTSCAGFEVACKGDGDCGGLTCADFSYDKFPSSGTKECR